jgi:tripartite-type tricarboxylate transporter receptor subunit TctC
MTRPSLPRRALFAYVTALAAAPLTGAWAQPAADAALPKPALQSYKFVVGFAPGGVPDAAARAIAAKLSERWKTPAVVENKLGVGGTLAAQAVLSAPADGATILSVSPAHATAPAVFRKLPYDTLRDFAPVTLIGEGPALLVVPNDLKVKNLAELVAQARAQPGKLSYSSAGIGSSSHFAAALFCIQAGIDVVNIPYKGVAEAMTETIAGRVQFHIAPYISAVKLVKEGKVRALAVTGRQRVSELPDVPTVGEAGVTGYEWTFWYGLLASAKTPAPVVEQLHKDITAILKLPDVRKQLELMGVDVAASSPADFGKVIEAEVAKYARIAKAANIQPE